MFCMSQHISHIQDDTRQYITKRREFRSIDDRSTVYYAELFADLYFEEHV